MAMLEHAAIAFVRLTMVLVEAHVVLVLTGNYGLLLVSDRVHLDILHAQIVIQTRVVHKLKLILSTQNAVSTVTVLKVLNIYEAARNGVQVENAYYAIIRY